MDLMCIAQRSGKGEQASGNSPQTPPRTDKNSLLSSPAGFVRSAVSKFFSRNSSPESPSSRQQSHSPLALGLQRAFNEGRLNFSKGRDSQQSQKSSRNMPSDSPKSLERIGGVGHRVLLQGRHSSVSRFEGGSPPKSPVGIEDLARNTGDPNPSSSNFPQTPTRGGGTSLSSSSWASPIETVRSLPRQWLGSPTWRKDSRDVLETSQEELSFHTPVGGSGVGGIVALSCSPNSWLSSSRQSCPRMLTTGGSRSVVRHLDFSRAAQAGRNATGQNCPPIPSPDDGGRELLAILDKQRDRSERKAEVDTDASSDESDSPKQDRVVVVAGGGGISSASSSSRESPSQLQESRVRVVERSGSARGEESTFVRMLLVQINSLFGFIRVKPEMQWPKLSSERITFFPQTESLGETPLGKPPREERNVSDRFNLNGAEFTIFSSPKRALEPRSSSKASSYEKGIANTEVAAMLTTEGIVEKGFLVFPHLQFLLRGERPFSLGNRHTRALPAPPSAPTMSTAVFDGRHAVPLPTDVPHFSILQGDESLDVVRSSGSAQQCQAAHRLGVSSSHVLGVHTSGKHSPSRQARSPVPPIQNFPFERGEGGESKVFASSQESALEGPRGPRCYSLATPRDDVVSCSQRSVIASLKRDVGVQMSMERVAPSIPSPSFLPAAAPQNLSMQRPKRVEHVVYQERRLPQATWWDEVVYRLQNGGQGCGDRYDILALAIVVSSIFTLGLTFLVAWGLGSSQKSMSQWNVTRV